MHVPARRPARRRRGRPSSRRRSPSPTPARLQIRDAQSAIGAPARSSPPTPSPRRSGSSASTTTRCRAAASIKPLPASRDDGPSDAAVVTPVLGSWKGLAIAQRDQPAVRRPRSVRDGRGRDRRGGAQRRRRRRRPDADRDPRQLLLGQRQRPGGARLARPRRGGVPRRGARVRHAVHHRQGLAEQRVPLGRPAHLASPARCSSRRSAWSPTCASA